MITSKKFRFFDKKLQKYIPQSGFLTLPFDNDEYIVEQYLGKRDINNKEVYEGDILAYVDREIKPQANYFQGEYWMSDDSYPFIDVIRRYYITPSENQFFERIYIGWVRTNSGIENGNPVKGLLNSCDFKDHAVIGNINENQDLLKL